MLAASVAVLSVGFAGSGSASAALPEFTSEATFKGSVGTSTFAEPGAREWKYGSGSLEGSIATKTTLSNVNVTLNNDGKSGCDNIAEGLVLEGVKGKLGYVNKAAHTVGVALGEPVSQALAKCEFKTGEREEYSGDVIATIEPVNTKTNHFYLKLSAVEGKPWPAKLEGGQEWPLLFGKYTCSKFLEKESCTSSSKKKLTVQAEISLVTATETEIKA